MNDIILAIRLLASYYEACFPNGSNQIIHLTKEHKRTWNRTFYRQMKLIGLTHSSRKIEKCFHLDFIQEVFSIQISSRDMLTVGEIRALVVAVDMYPKEMESIAQNIKNSYRKTEYGKHAASSRDDTEPSGTEN